MKQKLKSSTILRTAMFIAFQVVLVLIALGTGEKVGGG
jgi:hypothetical protein